MKKDIYMILFLISLIMLTGDSESFLMFLIWHLMWFAVMVVCVVKMEGTEE